MRKACSFLVLVRLCLVPAWGADALARPDLYQSATQPTTSIRPQFTVCAGVPAYDSGWEALGVRPDPISVNFTHDLGGDPDDYFVTLECRDDTALGTYDCTDQGFSVNAHWYGLTNTTVRVYAASGSQPDEVRVCIWQVHKAYLPVVFRN